MLGCRQFFITFLVSFRDIFPVARWFGSTIRFLRWCRMINSLSEKASRQHATAKKAQKVEHVCADSEISIREIEMKNLAGACDCFAMQRFRRFSWAHHQLLSALHENTISTSNVYSDGLPEWVRAPSETCPAFLTKPARFWILSYICALRLGLSVNI